MWLHYKEVDFSNEEIQQFHVDTRDFHVSTIMEPSEDVPSLNKLKKYTDRFFYTSLELKTLLDSLFIQSGEDKSWRYLTINGDWNLKYLRIYRTSYGLLICDSYNYAQRKDNMVIMVER